MAPVNYFELALQNEGILGTPLEALARSTFRQESASGRNTATSNAGARGPMQVLPGTFRGVADPDWNIDDPLANTRAGIRYLKQGWQASGGDPTLTAAFYYGGPGGMTKLANGIAVRDPRNPNAPNTAQYANQVVSRAGLLNTGNNMAILNTPADPNQPMTGGGGPQYTPNPILRNDPNAGILERIANAPGLSDGLISMGAGLLSASSGSAPLSQGLAKGFTGFNEGYTRGIENSKARAVPIAGGAFTQITDAQGNVTVVPNNDAQDFILKGLGIRGQIARDNMQYKFDNQPLSAGEQRELKEIDEGINGATSKLGAIERARTALSSPKINDSLRIAASGLPFGKAISEALGLPEADANRLIEDLKVDAWLVKSAFLKGAISDAENKRLNAPMPSSFASKEALNTWMDERERDLRKMQEGYTRIRETDYRKGGRPPAAPSAPQPAGNPVPPPAPVETQPLPPVGGGGGADPNNPLGLAIPSRARNN